MAGDAVRERLTARGAAPHVVEGGLEGLVAAWDRTTKAAARGATDDLDAWRNDVDARQILHEVWPVATEAQRAGVEAQLALADRRFRRATRWGPVSVWGPEATRRAGWTPEESWWYFLIPRKAGSRFAADVARLAARARGGP
jgi:hypothetical protein